MTSAARVVLVTPDGELARAVGLMLMSLGLSCDEADHGAPVEGEPRAALVDVRDLDAEALDAALEPFGRDVPVVVLVSTLEAVPALISGGASGFALSGESAESLALRLWNCARRRPAVRLGADLRKLIRHDIRTPLAVVLGQCEILSIELGGPLTDKQRRSVDAISRQTSSLKDMVDEIIDKLDPFWA